jgi:hypothetical protein
MLSCWILKGETHKLFWPEQSEFVRMAARFGCTIIPISSFGEDEVLDIVLDLDDLRRIPFGERLLLTLPQIRYSSVPLAAVVVVSLKCAL